MHKSPNEKRKQEDSLRDELKAMYIAGNEEPIKAYDQVIRIDQLRNANRLEGRLADQKSIVNFRTTSRDVLAYWAADRVDQLAFLTLSVSSRDETTMTGMSRNRGSARSRAPSGCP